MHFKASTEPVGTILSNDFAVDTCPIRSAGTVKHEYTTGYAFSDILVHLGYCRGGNLEYEEKIRKGGADRDIIRKR